MKELVEKAQKIAINNFDIDKFGAPAQDEDLLNLMKGNKVGDPKNIVIMKAYVNKWEQLRMQHIEKNFVW